MTQAKASSSKRTSVKTTGFRRCCMPHTQQAHPASSQLHAGWTTLTRNFVLVSWHDLAFRFVGAGSIPRACRWLYGPTMPVLISVLVAPGRDPGDAKWLGMDSGADFAGATCCDLDPSTA